MPIKATRKVKSRYEYVSPQTINGWLPGRARLRPRLKAGVAQLRATCDTSLALAIAGSNHGRR